MEKNYILFFIVCSFILLLVECRQGWKTTGNGYFVYKTTTNFNATGSLEITGKFSTSPYNQGNNVLVAVEDASGNLTFQYSMNKDSGETVISQGNLLQKSSSNVVGGNAGYLFSFTLRIEQTKSPNGTYNHIVRSSLSVDLSVADNIKWNYDNITIYIGGYRRSVESGNNFAGCLSDFNFQGVNIINTYFQQYPNNTNPVKGSLTIGSFSNVAQMCSDVTSTVQTSTTITGTTVTPTTGSSAVQNIASFKWLLLTVTLILFLQ